MNYRILSKEEVLKHNEKIFSLFCSKTGDVYLYSEYEDMAIHICDGRDGNRCVKCKWREKNLWNIDKKNTVPVKEKELDIDNKAVFDTINDMCTIEISAAEYKNFNAGTIFRNELFDNLFYSKYMKGGGFFYKEVHKVLYPEGTDPLDVIRDYKGIDNLRKKK